jgi:DNA-binding response OmpR family regulator
MRASTLFGDRRWRLGCALAAAVLWSASAGLAWAAVGGSVPVRAEGAAARLSHPGRAGQVAEQAADAAAELTAATLGREIFFDTSLSASGQMACSTCHDPAHAHAPANALSVQLGRLRLDLPRRRAHVDEAPLELTPREFGLLEALAARLDRVMSREQLVEALCSWDTTLTDNGLDIAVYRLRRKLENSGVRIRTVRGLGYLLEAADA